MRIFLKTLVGLGACIGSVAANAAFLTLTPDMANLQTGDSFSIELFMDASDAPGPHPSEFSGLVALQFDSTYVDFTGFSFSAPASELQAVSVSPSGADDIVTFGFENATDVGVIGTYSFVLNDSPDPLAPVGTMIQFDVYDADDFFDSFVNELDTNQSFPLDPAVSSTTVTVVPLPAPLVFLASALATLAPLVRGQASS